ncbi:MAG TPA: galactokinase [Actinomycetes bacterium]|nr:galactokinase [Actinomycetes bacterium]
MLPWPRPPRSRLEVLSIHRSTSRLAPLAEAFRSRAGRAPEGVWFAPGRVNLIGEHTDYSDGFVLPVAIDRGVLVAAAPRADGRLRCWSAQEAGQLDVDMAELGPGRVEGWAAYPAGVAWALGQAGLAPRGADLLADGDVPAGAGLSSSAALECATILALADLQSVRSAPAPPDRVELARLARRAEVEAVGMPCGVMDQMASMLARAGHALFLDTRSLVTEHLPLDLDAAGLRLLVTDTRASHRLVDGAYAERHAAVAAAARTLGVPALRDATLEQVRAAARELGEPGLRRARHVVTENARVLEAVELLRAGALDRLGPLLAASHASLRDDFEVSCPELDTAVEAALAGGAVGARMTGAGFGGSALALVPEDRVEPVTAGVRAAFAAEGFRPPEILLISPEGGASRLA